MKNHAVTAMFLCLFVILYAACGSGKTTENKKLHGKWVSKDGKTKLQITPKQFILDEDGSIQEDYILKGDTILTSFEGNQPYTRFVIQKLDEHQLSLFFPDSVTVEFSR